MQRLRLTSEQRLQIVDIYFQNLRSVRKTYRALRQVYGAHNRTSEQLIRNTMDRLMTRFTLLDNIYPNRARTMPIEEAIAATSRIVVFGVSTILMRLHYIIGPFVFKSETGANITVNGEHYRQIICDFFIHVIENNLEGKWFQQDGATCDIERATITLSSPTFGGRIISRNEPVNLTALDYFLWGYVKSLVHADKPATIYYLEANIRRKMESILMSL